MLPLVLDHSKISVGLAGAGELLARRRAWLAEAGIVPAEIALEAQGAALESLDILYVAGADFERSAALAREAKRAGLLVNVEDIPELCDFHVPAVLRRGDLLLTVSTGGRSPGLVQLVRHWLAEQFGAEWGARVEDIGQARDAWRRQGLPPSDIAARTKAYVAERKWLG